MRSGPRRRLAPLNLIVLSWSSWTSSCAHDAEAPPGGQWVHDLTIKGNRAVSSGDIRDRLATQETGWWPFAKKKWFDPTALDTDLERIPAFYADRGYFDARVVKRQVNTRDDHAVDITITVEENAPTKIQKVELLHFPAGEEPRARKAAARRDVAPGEIARYDEYSNLRKALERRLVARGHAYAAVSGELAVDRDRHAATVTVDAAPGPEVRMGKTEVTGNGSIPARAIRNRVVWEPGDLYDPRAVEATQARIYDLGVFSLVRVDLPPEPTETADVHIQVTPGRLRELRFGAGIAAERLRQEVRLRAEWTINNFLGGLRKLRLRLRPAYVVIPSVFDVARRGFAAENDAQLTQPDVFGSKAALIALVGFDVGISEGYQYYGPRGQVGVERPFWRDRVRAGGSFNLQYLDFYDVDEGAFGDPGNRFFGFVDPYRLAYLEEFAQLDLRDQRLDPTLGTYLTVRFEQGTPFLGAQFHYYKITPEVRGYVPLGRRAVLAGRALFGWLGAYAGDDSPITRRYALGGPANHRGFGFGRLAPQVPDSQGRLIPIGGDGEVLFSLETRVTVTKISGFPLRLVPFVDAGDVTPTFSDIDFTNLNIAVGLDVEYPTPIGAIRAGLGVRVNRMGDGNPDPNDRIAFHITIGEAF